MKPHFVEFKGFMLDIANSKLDYMEPVERQQLMDKLLFVYLHDTIEKNSFYRNIWQKNQIDLSSFKNQEDFRKIPLLGLETIESIEPHQLLPDEYKTLFINGKQNLEEPKKISQWFSSSGSTGKPKEVYYTQKDWDNTMGAIIRGMNHIPLEQYNRTLICFHMGHVGGPVFHDAINRNGGIVNKKIFSYTEPEQVLDQIKNGHQSFGHYNCLAIPPQTPPGAKVKKGVTLKDLLDSDVDNYIGKYIRVIITTGAPRPQSLLERVWEANELAGKEKTRFIDWAGCAEVLPTIAECEYNDGMHTLPGVTYTEVINEATGEHVKNGETGLLVYTGLKQGSRYIRYLVGDEAIYINEPCKCGRTTPRIKNLTRVKDKARLAGGCAAGF